MIYIVDLFLLNFFSENGHDDGESTASAGKSVNEPSRGKYDSHDETDSVSSFNPDNGKVKFAHCALCIILQTLKFGVCHV